LDSETALTPAKRYKLFLDIKQLGVLNWHPFPVSRIYVPKPDGRQRPIGISTIQDRVIQNVVRNALEPKWEAHFEVSSYGFRPGRQVNDVVSRINRILMQPSKRWVFEGDLYQCFDKINHSFLLSRLVYFPGQKLIEKWLKSGSMTSLPEIKKERTRSYNLMAEVSSLKKNLFRMPNADPCGRTVKFFYARYADDWILLSNTNRQICERWKSLIKDFLSEKLGVNIVC
jgi:RNA-directed DNA polymerase